MAIKSIIKNRKIFNTALITIFSLVVFGCGEDKVAEIKEVVRPVKILKIGNGTNVEILEYSGKVSAASEIQMAFEVPGKLVDFSVTDGFQAKKGDVLGRIDSRDYKASLDAKTAQLEAAKADYDRARSLFETNTIPRKELDAERRNFKVAEANYKVAKKQLEDTKIKAPFTGRVSKTLMDNFQNVQAKQPVLVFSDDSNLEIVVNVPEIDFVKRNPDWDFDKMTELLAPSVVLSAVPGRSFPAKLTEVSTSADPVTRTFEVTFAFSSPKDIAIYPGMTAKLIITDPTTLELISEKYIPANAVKSDEEGNAMVWLVDPSSMTVKRHRIKIGDMSGGNLKVTSGLKSGDLVAVSGVHQLRKGMKVKEYTN
jgi:RND family efflux transporter MFP subunit